MGDYVILPEVISNEPLTLVARPDQAFEASLFWAFQVMLNADAHGITSANVGAIVADLAQQPADVQRLFGSDSATTDMAAKLGLPKDWAYQVVKQVGSYGEVFDRTSAPPRPSVWTGPRRSTPMWGMAA
ncbi:hypothetical protein [Frigidibacter mobilis]|uniref:hypothetical protein n=1 Tax=Frigidibacter mobilis TaxID=1335048 RepID=UPI00082D1F8B|nr:hypothetical protein [Frigidibacter mobilis]